MVLRWRRDGVGHFEVVSDLPFQRAAMRMRFDGMVHFEVVSDLPFPRKAEHAREAECSRVVWVRPRDGAGGWGRARAVDVGSGAGLNVLPWSVSLDIRA